MSDHAGPDERIVGTRAGLVQAGFDALLVTPGADLRYLTGYDALPLERLTCLLLPASGEPCLVVPALEEPAAQASAISGLGMQIIPWQETEDPVALVAGILSGNDTAAATIALDDHMWAEKVLAFRDAMPQARQVLAGPVLRSLRMRKSTAEIRALREAGGAIDRVHARMEQWLRVGRTEREVGADIAEAIIAEGHARVDFVIVASGPNGASPHAEVSERVVEAGEPSWWTSVGPPRPATARTQPRRTAWGTRPGGFIDYYSVPCSRSDLACDAHATHARH